MPAYSILLKINDVHMANQKFKQNGQLISLYPNFTNRLDVVKEH